MNQKRLTFFFGREITQKKVSFLGHNEYDTAKYTTILCIGIKLSCSVVDFCTPYAEKDYELRNSSFIEEIKDENSSLKVGASDPYRVMMTQDQPDSMTQLRSFSARL